VLPEGDSGRAIQLIAEYRQGLHELLAPDVFPVEVGHALTRAAMNHNCSRQFSAPRAT
jgi:hypothetical protein